MLAWSIGKEEPDEPKEPEIKFELPKSFGERVSRTLFSRTPTGEMGNDGEEPLVTDRPDFTEASSTVGKGRVQVELGYTYFSDKNNGVRARAHSYPEVLTVLVCSPNGLNCESAKTSVQNQWRE